MRKLVVGCGYLGHRVATLWREHGDAVAVVTRNADRLAALRTEGFEAICADIVKPETLQPDELRAGVVLFAVGFDRQSGHSIEDVYVGGLRNVLNVVELSARDVDVVGDAGKFIYISSTGVYGQTDGQWVDEDSVCKPIRVGGKACLAAEQELLAHPLGSRAIILRLAGIYGPGRVPRRADLSGGGKVTVSDGYLNLIHVDDAARIVLAAEKSAMPPRTLVVSDGGPVLRHDYYREVARQMGLKEPEFALPAADASPRGTGSKRIDNRRMQDDLGVELAFPSYREGLAHALVG